MFRMGRSSALRSRPHSNARFPILAVVLLHAFVAFGFATRASAAELSIQSVVQDGILRWDLYGPAGASELVVADPLGAIHRSSFVAGQTPVFAASGADGPRPDGNYRFELRVAPIVRETESSDSASSPEDGRSTGPSEVVGGGGASGTFSLSGGHFVRPDLVEPTSGVASGAVAAVDGGDSLVTGIVAPVLPEDQPLDVVTADDSIVQGSICVGFDCVNNESFGADTIRLKENNLRIHFDDTSATGAFPSNDWRLTANDQANGGASYFSIDDATAGRTVFRVTAGARANSLFIDSAGRVGLGTSTPVLQFHVLRNDTPAMRLEQDNTGGYPAQTWDVAGNEANFFVRDVTGGSLLPFRIRPGAPTSSIDIAASGAVGIGTASPASRLQVNQLANSNTVLLALDDSGNLEINGTLTESSDVNAKENFAPVDPSEVLDKVSEIPVTSWNFKHDDDGLRHIGPMAQDFHAAFGVGSDETRLAPLDVNGVTLAAIQGLDRVRRDQEARIEELSKRNAELEARLAAIERIAGDLLARESAAR